MVRERYLSRVNTPTITPDEFFAADLRVGRVLTAQPFPEARKPAIKLTIDFGELGVRRSSAQLTVHYKPEDLVGRLVVAVVNFPPRQIGPFISEVLVLGACTTPSDVVLLQPDMDVPLGTRIS
jgi:tRNA-binding protein